jgi:plasmid stability protein
MMALQSSITIYRLFLKKSRAVASITIRNLEDDIKQRLRVRAAEHGCSMEEEARDILRREMAESAPPRNLAVAIRARLSRGERADLEIAPREQMRSPPNPRRKRA